MKKKRSREEKVVMLRRRKGRLILFTTTKSLAHISTLSWQDTHIPKVQSRSVVTKQKALQPIRRNCGVVVVVVVRIIPIIRHHGQLGREIKVWEAKMRLDHPSRHPILPKVRVVGRR